MKTEGVREETMMLLQFAFVWMFQPLSSGSSSLPRYLYPYSCNDENCSYELETTNLDSLQNGPNFANKELDLTTPEVLEPSQTTLSLESLLNISESNSNDEILQNESERSIIKSLLTANVIVVSIILMVLIAFVIVKIKSRKKLPDNPNSNASGMKIWVEESAPSRAQNHYSPLAQIDQFRDNRLILQTDSLRANSSTESDRSYEKVFELKSFSGDLDIHQKRSESGSSEIHTYDELTFTSRPINNLSPNYRSCPFLR